MSDLLRHIVHFGLNVCVHTQANSSHVVGKVLAASHSRSRENLEAQEFLHGHATCVGQVLRTNVVRRCKLVDRKQVSKTCGRHGEIALTIFGNISLTKGLEQEKQVCFFQSRTSVMDLSSVCTRVHCCNNQLVGLAAKSGSSRLSNGLTLVDVDLQFVKLVDVFRRIEVRHRSFDIGVCQFHRSDVAIARLRGSRASADLLETCSRTRHIGRADGVP